MLKRNKNINGMSLLLGINKAHQGAERMRSTLNLYFGEMIDFIVDAGGDVVKFAGDALMAVWRLEAGCALYSFTSKLSVVVA